MKISNLNTGTIFHKNSKSNVRFTGESKTIKDDDGKEYVKVPKKQYDLDKLCGWILLGTLAIELIYVLLKKKQTM